MSTKVEIADSGVHENTDHPKPKEVEAKVERPEWLPEKFKSPEDMAKAYGELEKKQAAPEAPADGTTEAPQITKEEPKPDNEYFKTYEEEFANTGKLSEASYNKLQQDKGLTPDQVNRYIAGVVAEVKEVTDSIYQSVGGQNEFEKMAEWGGRELADDQLATINDLLAGDKNKAVLGAKALKEAYVSVHGQSSNLVKADGLSTSGDSYASYAEMMADMRDPRYRADPAFNKKVADKLARSGDLM